MAKGSARRTYNRDARGRFASTNSSGTPKPRRGALKPGGGTAKARTSLARSKKRLAAADPADRSLKGALSRRSQKGAVTRAKKALKEAKKAAQVRLNVGPKKGVIRRASRPKAVDSQPRPVAAAKAKQVKAQSRATELRQRASVLRQRGYALMDGGSRDGATVNLSLNSRARSGETNAGFRGLEMVRLADRLESRARGVEVKAAESAAKAVREAAKPKRTRGAAPLRASRARRIVERREQKISGSYRQWENSVRTERRALAFLKVRPLPLTGQQAFWRNQVK